MIKFIIKRILTMIPVMLGVGLLVFIVLDLAPGDAAQSMLGEYADPASLEALREEMGLNDPLLLQYGKWVWNIVSKGDLGTSYRTGASVTQEIFNRYPTTMLVALLGVLFTALVGIATGIVSAVKQYSIWDHLATFVGMVGVSMPSFWTGLMLVLIFAQKLGWLPASGNFGLEYYILPIITISFTASASQMRMTRSSMLEVMRQDYIRTARAKGQNEGKVILHHQLRNALIPIITVIGTQAGILLGGTMIVEQIFAIPGVGKLLMDSINYRDFPMIRAGILLLAVSFSVVNLLVDLMYAMVDPRIRSQFSSGSKRKKVKGAAV